MGVDPLSPGSPGWVMALPSHRSEGSDPRASGIQEGGGSTLAPASVAVLEHGQSSHTFCFLFFIFFFVCFFYFQESPESKTFSDFFFFPVKALNL